jgi:hypothetical protein
MYIYNYRLFDRYGRYVASLVVLGTESSKWQPGKFNYKLWQCKINFKFPVVKLVNYRRRWTELEASDNPLITHRKRPATSGAP